MPAGVLLRSPLEMSQSASNETRDRSEVKFSRVQPDNMKNLSDKFRLKHRDFQRQYFHFYNRRLEAMRPRIEAQGRSTISSDITILPLCRLNAAEKDQDVFIVGTLFKMQSLKPNILQQLSETGEVLPQPAHQRYTSDDDSLILEDDLQRIKVRGNVEVSRLVSGIVCGLYGQEKESGKFEVKDIIFATPPPQSPLPSLTKDKFIIFMSGLELADKSSPCLMPLQLAVDFICGDAGEMMDQESMAAVAQVIIAGNCLNESTRNTDELNKAKYLTKNNQAASIDAVNLMDEFLVQLAGSVSTYLMPGEFDPSSHILPQQPFHPCLFPLASVFPTLNTVSNPYMFNMDGLQVLGSSGQNVDDIMRNSDLESPLDAMESIVKWSHFAPTCPDTLGCFPYKDKDPFVMEEIPHLMFTSNQDKFEQRVVKHQGKKVTLLSIPKFSKTFSVVKFNLRTQHAEEIQFSAEL